MEKKVEFGTRNALNSRTPLWAKNMFRITFAITTALSVFIAATQLISDEWKFEIMLGFKALDGLMFTLSKLFGVTIEAEEQ